MSDALDSKALETLNKALKSAGDASGSFAQQLNRGTFTVKNAMDAFSGMLSHFSLPGKLAGGALSLFTEKAYETAEAMKMTSKYGITFGNNFGEYAVTVNSAKLRLEDFSSIIDKNSTSIAGLGGNMDKSGRILLAVSKEAQTGIGSDMMALGVTAKEMTDLTALYLGGQRNLFNGTKSQTQAIKEAATGAQKLAYELLLTSNITGKRNELLQQEIQEQVSRAEAQAMIAGMDSERQQLYITSMGSISSMGPQVEKLFTDLSVYGAPVSKETQAIAAAMGDSLPYLVKFKDAVKNGTTEEIESSRKLLLQHSVDMVNSEAYRNRVKAEAASPDSPTSSATLNFYKEMLSLSKSTEAEMTELKNKNLGDFSSKVAQEEQRKTENNKLKDLSADGTVDIGQSIARSYNNLNNVFMAGTADMAKLFKVQNEELGKQMGGDYSKIESEFHKYANPKEMHSKLMEITDNIVNNSDIFSGSIVTLKKGVEATTDALTQFKTFVFDIMSSGRTPKTRETGTLGETGLISEPTDFFGMVHKGETVMTPEHVRNFMSNATNQGSIESLRNINDNLLRSFKEIKIENPIKNENPLPEIKENINIQPSVDNSIMKEMNSKLIELNYNMIQLINLTRENVDTSQKELSAIRNLSGNRLA